MFNHPEVSKHGLELNYNVYVQFNRELQIRMQMERPEINGDRKMAERVVEQSRVLGILDMNYLEAVQENEELVG